ncbi:TIGR01244 family sulfur transferase [Pseudaestuariivita atlantica]|uniref:Beta-lactamase hydrolase-like protein phosphatase-like domain-containing protein n=1 Tax=Pseudaestuariivita atlantica TaxID=1317121 RepID=A0A0L1JTB1_9RHOB|nr:TIGR01244 family sulfur transferase [Pseudaestuariivita atlantica]KNG95009.1 hypothetical protein ATO11_06520 [Pseudaestuariivita atlantica]
MDIRQITPAYSVSEQILPEDVPAIAEAGFTTIICNRPDAENPPHLQADAVRAAAEAAGLRFHALPLTHQTMTPDNIAAQAAHIAASDGPTLAYCASGTRSTVAWALGQAGERSADDILATTAKAGYALDGLRPTLDAIAKRG